MDLMKVLTDLKREREAVEEAIITLERLVRGQGKRRGRPPKWMTEMKNRAEEKPAPARRGRRPKEAGESK
jgi:hypothetical protein